jgi:hypothetical protein
MKFKIRKDVNFYNLLQELPCNFSSECGYKLEQIVTLKNLKLGNKKLKQLSNFFNPLQELLGLQQ